jgi:putative ABC transport system substrate-binding protein
VKRRQFIAGLGSAAAWPPAARAQQGPTAVIGLLQIGAPSSWDFTGFRQGLKDMGYLEGENLAINVRWANNDPDRLPELAADLVHRQVRVIVALGSVATVRAAKAATNTIPIVIGFGVDPVQQGLVASLNQPGGNVTGMTSLSDGLLGKQLGILHELLPTASHFGLLSDLNSPVHELMATYAQSAASAIGGRIEVLTASTRSEIDTAFARLAIERRRPRRRQFRSFLGLAQTRFNTVWPPASMNPEVMSPASTTSAWISARSGWGCCASCCQLRRALPFSPILLPHPLNQASLRLKAPLRPWRNQ